MDPPPFGLDTNNNWSNDLAAVSLGSTTPIDPPPPESELSDEARAFTDWVRRHVTEQISLATQPLQTEIGVLRARLATLEASPRTTVHHAAPARAPSFKVNPPHEFDGSRETGEGFLNACRLYLQLQPEAFPNLEARIGWILSYMTSGRARSWRDAAISHRASYGGYSWFTEKAFYDAFEAEFFPVAEAEASLIALESDSYHQRPSEGIDVYVDRFRELSKKAKLENSPALVVKFRRGLGKELHLALSQSPQPPSPSDVEDWITRARALEHSRTVHKTISGEVRSHSTPARAPPAPRPSFANSAPPAPPRSFFARPAHFIPARPPAPPSVAPTYTPMELDAARRRRAQFSPTDICSRCQQPGHWARECPKAYDIRYMDGEEVEEFQALAKDIWAIRKKAEMESEATTSTTPSEGFGEASE